MSLSTFSAHVRNLVGILAIATKDSLVLLDEIAAGTDPVEGAALAEAILSTLADQARLTVTTSHYAELKEWASATTNATNAATAIDPITHEPLYTVSLGRPGSSHALQTAERLGLSETIVESARRHVAPERLRVAALVAEAEIAARSADAALAAATAEKERAERRAARGRGRRAASARGSRPGEILGRSRAAAGTRRGRGRARDRPGGDRRASSRDSSRAPARARARASDHDPPPTRRSVSAIAVWAPPPTAPRARLDRSRDSINRCHSPAHSQSGIPSSRRNSASAAPSPRSAAARPPWSARAVCASAWRSTGFGPTVTQRSPNRPWAPEARPRESPCAS